MLARLTKMKDENEGGFTLIELLVVIIIIGILAAIAIPIFLNQRKKGYVAADKSELNSISISEESYATDNNGAYTNVVANLSAQGYNVSSPYTAAGGVVLTTSTDNSKWCAQVINSADPTVSYAQSSTTGVAASGSCSAGGVFSSTTA